MSDPRDRLESQLLAWMNERPMREDDALFEELVIVGWVHGDTFLLKGECEDSPRKMDYTDLAFRHETNLSENGEVEFQG